jgi:hypothetical protein
MNRGDSAESASISRRRLIAAFSPLLEVDERAVRPEPLTQLFAADPISRSVQQLGQHLE